MKYIYFALPVLLLLSGCASGVGFGIGGVAGGDNIGTEVVITQDGIHGSVAAGADIVH